MPLPQQEAHYCSETLAVLKEILRTIWNQSFIHLLLKWCCRWGPGPCVCPLIKQFHSLLLFLLFLIEP